MSDFTWLPTIGFTKDTTPKVKTSKFGDGYSQRVPDGINNMVQAWNLQFQAQTLTTAAAIENFLSSKQGVYNFTWTPPGESSEVRVICTKWTKTYDSSISRTISATFERVYE
jgi:phage-related protein